MTQKIHWYKMLSNAISTRIRVPECHNDQPATVQSNTGTNDDTGKVQSGPTDLDASAPYVRIPSTYPYRENIIGWHPLHHYVVSGVGQSRAAPSSHAGEFLLVFFSFSCDSTRIPGSGHSSRASLEGIPYTTCPNPVGQSLKNSLCRPRRRPTVSGASSRSH